MSYATITKSVLTKRQVNSLLALQEKVEHRPHTFTRVTDAQFAAMKKAYLAVKASGLPIPPEMIVEAKNLGLE